MEYWDHTVGPQERVALRVSAVQAVSNGEKKRHVALRLGVTRQTLHNWVAKHQHGGTAALAAKPRGRVGRQELAPWREAPDGALSRSHQTAIEASIQLR